MSDITNNKNKDDNKCVCLPTREERRKVKSKRLNLNPWSRLKKENQKARVGTRFDFSFFNLIFSQPH